MGADEFAFRHALTQQALTAQLLGRERQRLHLALARTIGELHGAAPDGHLAALAHHFFAGGDWAGALVYAQQAGEQAQRLYVPQVAVEHFSRALEAAHHHTPSTPSAHLYRARGRAYETLGDFELARSDYETALGLARASGERWAEWQALLDLGLLWAGRDYAQAGDHYRRALALARTLDDPVTVAYSLNRLGNWHANIEQPDEALRHHHEALAIFQTADDLRGRAETLDLLGMASFISGDPQHCALYYEQAIRLFRTLDRRQGLASTLATLAACGPTYQLSIAIPAAKSADMFVDAGEEALRLAREIGWRSGEAYALGVLAQGLGARGEYARAWELAQAAIAVAEEIEHRQWLAHAHWVAGMLMLDLLALPAARQHLEQALALAQAAGSWHWIRNTTAFLAAVSSGEGDLAEAAALLDQALGQEEPALTLGQRLVWCARAELALVGGDADHALQIVDELIASARSAATSAQGRSIARLMKVRGEALAALGRAADAEGALVAAQATARTQGSRPLLWRTCVALGALYSRQRRHHDAANAVAAARTIIEELATEIDDVSLRQNFLDRAMAMLPRLSALSPLRTTKQAFGGLTAREREVAALIVQGKSNREIADEITVGLRTVEAHITHILNKLGFSSRAQIAVWAVEKGLAQAASDNDG
jgi:DNA-binding CsgD family transcriptional regulator/Flp pilus assembly protein TadD